MPKRIQPGFLGGEVQIRSTDEFILHASVAETGNGSGTAQTVGDYAEGILDIDITAVSGTTPSATFKLETFVNGQWRAIPGVTIAAQTATGSVTVAVTNFGESVRLSWTITGTTPSITFKATFTAKT